MSESNGAYPKRGDHFDREFIRWLRDSGIEHEIGDKACWFLTKLVLREDELHYSQPVRLWVKDLRKWLGGVSKTHATDIRTKLVGLGVLHHQKTGHRSIGNYWVLMSPLERTHEGAMSSLEWTHETMSSLERTHEGAMSSLERTHEGAMSPLERTPSNPKNPNTKESAHSPFDDWWKLYPKKMAKKAARAAYPKAVKEICKDRGCDEATAHGILATAVGDFAKAAPKRGSEKWDFIPYPAKWLNEGRYDDEVEAGKDKALPPIVPEEIFPDE